MTPKQNVIMIHPSAKLVKYGRYYHIETKWKFGTIRYGKGQKFSPRMAWAEAWKLIQKEMIEKLAG